VQELILILGGARSGKSTFAQDLALELGGPDVLYIATAEGLDDEMRERIATHRAERPAGWRTLEAPRQVATRVAAAAGGARVVLLDCLTVLVSNLILAHAEQTPPAVVEAAVQGEIQALLAAAAATSATWIVVSNEVGLGLVPPSALGRLYRDVLGRVNQLLAQRASQVQFLVAGLPLRFK
jgi:adenosylcobinamide kinase/adenosylcobinamide-phosphate guanylyltransferase